MSSLGVIKTNVRYSFLLLFLSYTSVFFSQSNSDSLAGRSKSDLETLYKNSKNSTPSIAKAYAEAIYKLANKKNDKKDLSKALYKKAYIENKMANNDNALIFIKESEAIAKAINNDSLLLKNANLKGTIYLHKSQYVKSIKYYIEAKSIAERMGNFKDVLIISRNVAIIKKEINDLQGALDILLGNLKRIESLNKIKKEFNLQKLLIYFSLVDTYLRLENVEMAIFYNEKGLHNSSGLNYAYLNTSFLSNKAIISYQLKQFNETIDICNRLLSDPQKSLNSKLQITNYLYLGKSYFELNDYALAILNFEKIKSISNNYKDVSPFNLKEIYYYLAKSYIKIDKPDYANQNFDLLMTLDKENDLITKNAERKIYKSYDIENLKIELESLNNKLFRQKKTAYYIYGIALLIIIAIILFYKKKQKINKFRFNKLVLEIEKIEQQKNEIIINRKDKLVTDENVIQILNNLTKFEKNKAYLNKECTLSHLAKKINTNTSYLSNVINSHKGVPFKTYLTELRINETLIQLKNERKLRIYTIKAIASEFGFKRQETFSRAFKARTGIYPSTYIKNLENESNI